MRYAALELIDLLQQQADRERSSSGLVSDDRPLALVARLGGADRVVSSPLSAGRLDAGVYPTVEQLRALHGDLACVPAPFATAERTLQLLAELLLPLSPSVELCPPEGLLLDASVAQRPALWRHRQGHEISEDHAGDTRCDQDDANDSIGAHDANLSSRSKSILSEYDSYRSSEASAGLPESMRHETEWAHRVMAVVAGAGWRARLAVADTPLAARLVAQGLDDGALAVVSPHTQSSRVAAVPWDQYRARLQMQRLWGRLHNEDDVPGRWPELSDTTLALLAQLGLNDLGAVQRLPPATLLERWGREGERLAAVARGGRSRPLVGWQPPVTLVEDVSLEPAVADTSALLFVLRPVVERLSSRLQARGLAASRLSLGLELDTPEHAGPEHIWQDLWSVNVRSPADNVPGLRMRGKLLPPRRGFRLLPIRLARPSDRATSLLNVLRDRLEQQPCAAPVVLARVTVEETAEPQRQLQLGERPGSLEQLASVLSRLTARLGDDRVGILRLCDSNLLERSGQLVSADLETLTNGSVASKYAGGHGLRSHSLDPVGSQGVDISPDVVSALDPPDTRSELEALDPTQTSTHWPLRYFPPEPVQSDMLKADRLVGFSWRGRHHRVCMMGPPVRLSAAWWELPPAVRDYRVVALTDGARLWMFRDDEGRYWVEGIYD